MILSLMSLRKSLLEFGSSSVWYSGAARRRTRCHRHRSEREKLLAERYTNAVTARNEALERSEELEAEFQRMGEKPGQ